MHCGICDKPMRVIVERVMVQLVGIVALFQCDTCKRIEAVKR